MKQTIIGSRGSQLALWQARWVRDRLREAHSGLDVDIEIIKTTGDRLSEQALQASMDSKGLFVKEIEEALLDGRIHLAVHSLKDMPTELPQGLKLACIPRRADPRDALVARLGLDDWRQLPDQARVFTSSLRRRVQLLSLRPDFQVEDIRGNVDTRLRKMKEQQLDGLILAAAGLKRLELEKHISYLFPVEEMVPAVGQGALAVEIREDDSDTAALLAPIHHQKTADCVRAERTFLQRMGGGCQVPMGAHARIADGQATFDCFLASPLGREKLEQHHAGSRSSLEQMALASAQALLEQGAQAILAEFEDEEG
ncbi:MAG TPA: hydroxymethylbilane synthase [Acidobacteriota bacterium]|nr:hydroxymethylbilane synthase [Acidobacteriota bacterium]